MQSPGRRPCSRTDSIGFRAMARAGILFLFTAIIVPETYFRVLATETML